MKLKPPIRTLTTVCTAAAIGVLASNATAAKPAAKPAVKAAPDQPQTKPAGANSKPGGPGAMEDKEPDTVPFDSLPAPVRAAAEKELGSGQKLKAFKITEGGATSYDISADKEEPDQSVQLTATGDVIGSSRKVPPSQAPAAVQAALKKAYPQEKFEELELVTTHFYVAHSGGEKGKDVEVDPAGMISPDEGSDAGAAKGGKKK